MAVAQTGALRQAPTTTDLSGSCGLAVVVNASGNLVLAGAAVFIDGVLVDDPKTGQAGTYQVRDIAKVVAGAAITRGANLTTNASGQFITAATGNPIVGKALEAAGAASQVIRAEIGYRGVSP